MEVAVMYGQKNKRFGVWRRDNTMELIYKSRHIHSLPELNLEMDCWVPNADVFWEREGSKFHQLLRGPVGYFKIIDEAEIYAVEMAKTWIDAESMED
jgi:hypothetical protein